MLNIPAIDKQEWRPAVYNGRKIKNLWVSNYGFMRRKTKAGGFGQVSRGTPYFNKSAKGRLSQYMVMVVFEEAAKGQKLRTCVNLHRVLCCTFQGVTFKSGYDVDHIDHNVSNAFVGTRKGKYLDGNLRCVTHSQNMKNRPVVRPRARSLTPKAGEWIYRIKLELGVTRLSALPKAYINEYQRIRYYELRGREVKPRTIALRASA